MHSLLIASTTFVANAGDLLLQPRDWNRAPVALETALGFRALGRGERRDQARQKSSQPKCYQRQTVDWFATVARRIWRAIGLQRLPTHGAGGVTTSFHWLCVSQRCSAVSTQSLAPADREPDDLPIRRNSLP